MNDKLGEKIYENSAYNYCIKIIVNLLQLTFFSSIIKDNGRSELLTKQIEDEFCLELSILLRWHHRRPNINIIHYLSNSIEDAYCEAKSYLKRRTMREEDYDAIIYSFPEKLPLTLEELMDDSVSELLLKLRTNKEFFIVVSISKSESGLPMNLYFICNGKELFPRQDKIMVQAQLTKDKKVDPNKLVAIEFQSDLEYSEILEIMWNHEKVKCSEITDYDFEQALNYIRKNWNVIVRHWCGELTDIDFLKLTLWDEEIDENEEPLLATKINPALHNEILKRNEGFVFVALPERYKTSIPHVRIYHDNSLSTNKCSFIRLDKAEYLTYHNMIPLPENLQKMFLEIMSAIWTCRYIEKKDGTMRLATGYEVAVETWIDIHGLAEDIIFNIDEETGIWIMPEYEKLFIRE